MVLCMATQAKSLPSHDDRQAWNLFVFRKKRDILQVGELISQLREEILRLRYGAAAAADVLVRAGELETGLADAGRHDESHAMSLCDLVGAHACGLELDVDLALSRLAEIQADGEIECSHPEGFSYYGLNPTDFVAVARMLAPALAPQAAVIGIRSVGSALSSIVMATLRAGGTKAERITVRPEGEPYHRVARFGLGQQLWIRKNLEAGARFVVVDEGPGFSGSTLLSVAEALRNAGVPRSSIWIICSRPVDRSHGYLDEYQWAAVGYGRSIPPECDRNLGGGLWRELMYDNASQWPACWSELERIKHLSTNGLSLIKFEGFGRFGAHSRSQVQALSEAGFSPELLGFDKGFARYRWMNAQPLHRQDLTCQVLARMAQYCAFRAATFPAQRASAEPLLNMMRRNLEIEFGAESGVHDLPVEVPVYADCRMMPHEWLLTRHGAVLKSDSVGHAEGHQLPGPVDIAWDLAGVIVEWQLPEADADCFVECYRRASGDDARSRISGYLIAYLTYRMAHCRMGAAAMQYSNEGALLWRKYQQYRERVHTLVH